MVEYPEQDFENSEEKMAYREGYIISRDKMYLKILGIIERESYDQDVTTLDELLYQFGFDSFDEEKVIDMDFDDFDREDDFRRELMREEIEQQRKLILNKLRVLGVDVNQISYR